jgi:hypothetical protein
MPLTAQQTKSINESLIALYGKASVAFNGKDEFIVKVNDESRPARKAELSKIQKSLKSFGAKYTPPVSGGTGAVKISGVEIKVKGKKASAGPTGDTKFKPSDIVPSIVDVWLQPSEIVDNVKKYINSQTMDKSLKDQIIKLLELTAKDQNTTIPFDVDKKAVPSEFFEVLTSVKLAVLLRGNDARTRKILGIPKNMDLTKSKIKIYIPKKANMPLLDYFISITTNENKDEESSLKISVKSKVSSPKSNTVKFKDAFQSTKEVDEWYKNVADKRNNAGQKIIAESSIKTVTGGMRGKEMLYPLLAMEKLFKDQSKISNVIKSKFAKSENIPNLKNGLQKIVRHFGSVSRQTLLKEVPEIEALDIVKISEMMKANLPTRGAELRYDVGNLSLLCEKILEDSSKPQSATKYNFYQLFFDQVLIKKKLAYAVASRDGKTLKYNFYSLVNFTQEYKSWIELRTKNSVNQLNDALGMDV